jgi:hypothetical protein
MFDVAAGDIITAAYLRNLTNAGSGSASSIEAGSFNTASTTYSATLTGANVCGTAFIAPPSGTVLVLWQASILTAGSSGCLISFELRDGASVGSGTIITATNDNEALDTRISSNTRPANFFRQASLTPGNSYNVRLMHRSLTAANSTILRRAVFVTPIQ